MYSFWKAPFCQFKLTKMFTIIYGRREYAKKHLGQTGHPNASQLDLANFYPAMMHQATRATETIVRRIGQVADALRQNKKMVFRSTESCLKSLFKQL